MSEQTIHFISLGCPKNRVDSEVMLGVSHHAGYRVVAEPDVADVIVINTCGFIGPAKEESIDTILEMGRFKDEGQCKKLVVTGCLSQRYPEELAREMPEVDHFLGSSDMLKLKDVLSHSASAPRMLVGNPAEYLYSAAHPRMLSQGQASVFLKIAEGCARTCSFCAIPSIRGTQRSRPIDDIVAEAEALAAHGTVELNLVSQDTVAYGRDLKNGTTLAQLVSRLGDVPGVRWIRLFYLYPETLTDELIQILANHPKVVPYIDMPLQHASDSMLRRMRRGHGGKRLYDVVERLKKAIPNLFFRTAFIVGHPGETEEDFEALKDFVTWSEFDHVGVFLYSHEEGTRSGDMEADVPARTAKRRQRELMQLQRKISRKKLKAKVGDTIEVLVTGPSRESEFLLEGRHRGQAPEVDGVVHLANGTAEPGEIRQAIVTAAADYDLVADLLGADNSHQSPLVKSARKPAPRRLRVVDAVDSGH